jgi:hypothetical protein
MTRRHSKIVETQLEAMILPALELSRRLHAEPKLLDDFEAKTLIELATRSARPIADLMQAERTVRGTQDPDKSSEQHRRQREVEPNEELDALLIGMPEASLPATMTAKYARHIPRDG